MVAWRGDAPAKKSDGGTARGCAGQKARWWHGEGIRRPKERSPNRWVGGERAGIRRDQSGGECAGQVTQRQIGGGSAGDAPANEATPNRWVGGECAGKQSNTKSVDRRRMRRQKKQHQIGGSAANAPANKATPNRWIGGKCAGKRRHDDGMRRPDKQNAARR